MKRAIVLCLVIGLLIAGCGGVARESKKEPSPTSFVTPEVTGEAQGASTGAAPLAEEPTGPTAGSDAAGPVVILVPRAVETLDPYLMTTINPGGSVAAHVWDTLVWINDDLALEPHLAESWWLVNDITWEFKLRPNITFHNGEPFNAAAVKFSIERAAQLEGGLETFAADVGLQQVEIVDDYTVRLITAEADASLPYQLASVEMLPPGHYGSGEIDFASSPVGSGPYRFVSWDSEGQLVLEANPDYWQGVPTVKTLVFAAEPNLDQRLTALISGEVHIVSDLPPDRAAEAETDSTHLVAIEGLRRLFIGIRAEAGTPLADVRVRQALNYAVDVEAIIQNLMAGYGRRYGSWVNPPHDHPALLPWPYDPERAKSLLKEAGYPDGFKTAMDVPMDRYYRGQEVAQAVADDLAAIGIGVEIHTYEWSAYVQRLLSKNTAPLFLLSLQSRGNGVEDTANLSSVFPFNPSLWFNAEFEELLKEARGTFNAQLRQEVLNRAQAVAYDEAPWIWLWHQYEFYGVSNELDWAPRANGLIYLRPSIGGLVVSTFTPTPEATASPAIAPASTATDTPVNTPTLTLTFVALHTPTSTLTPVPTNTPSPTDTPTSTPYPAPILVGPEGGTSFPEGQDVKLVWEWERDLAENEFFEVRIRLKGEQEFDPMDLVKVPYRIVSASKLTQAGTYEWQVAIVSLAGEEKGASQIGSFEVR